MGSRSRGLTFVDENYPGRIAKCRTLVALRPSANKGLRFYPCSGVSASIGVERALLMALEADVVRSASAARSLRAFH